MKARGDQGNSGAGEVGLEMFNEGRCEPDQAMKDFGPQRLRLLVSLKRGADHRRKFFDDFAAFGAVTLPPPAQDEDAAKGRTGTDDRRPESTRP